MINMQPSLDKVVSTLTRLYTLRMVSKYGLFDKEKIVYISNVLVDGVGRYEEAALRPYWGVCMNALSDLDDAALYDLAHTFIVSSKSEYNIHYPCGGSDEYFSAANDCTLYDNPVRLQYIQHCIDTLESILKDKGRSVDCTTYIKDGVVRVVVDVYKQAQPLPAKAVPVNTPDLSLKGTNLTCLYIGIALFILAWLLCTLSK